MIWLLTATLLIACYVLFGRKWLKARSWMQWYFKSPAGEWVESWWLKSETILWARWQLLLAFLLQILPAIGAIDVTPVLVFVPEDYHAAVKAAPSIALGLNWIVTELLRRDTTRPLAVVSAPEAVKDASPEVRQAEIANIEAVAAVEVAKVQGEGG